MLDKSSQDSLGNKLVLNSNMAVMSVLCATDRNYLMLWITEIAATDVEDKDEDSGFRKIPVNDVAVIEEDGTNAEVLTELAFKPRLSIATEEMAKRGEAAKKALHGDPLHTDDDNFFNPLLLKMTMTPMHKAV